MWTKIPNLARADGAWTPYAGFTLLGAAYSYSTRLAK